MKTMYIYAAVGGVKIKEASWTRGEISLSIYNQVQLTLIPFAFFVRRIIFLFKDFSFKSERPRSCSSNCDSSPHLEPMCQYFHQGRKFRLTIMNVRVESGLHSCDLSIEKLMKGLQVVWQTGTGSLCTLIKKKNSVETWGFDCVQYSSRLTNQ